MTHLSITSDSQQEGTAIVCRDVTVCYQNANLGVSTLKEFVIEKLRGRLETSMEYALKGVDFYANRGECVGIVGHNGCGKSTLLKVIAGILTPTSGYASIQGRIAPLIELGAGFDPELTGVENIYLSCSLIGLQKNEIDSRLSWIIEFSELGHFIHKPVKTYSSGMYMRLGFSCAMAVDASIVLIDEILAVGDENFQKKCLAKIEQIRNSSVTIVLVSHDLASVAKMADRVYMIDKGCVKYEGPVEAGIRYYQDLMQKRYRDSNSSEVIAEQERQIRIQANLRRSFQKMAKILSVDVKVDLASTQIQRLVVNVETFAKLDKPVVVGFAIHAHKGVRITGGNTKIFSSHLSTDVSFLMKEGVLEVEFNFGNLRLSTGEYDVYVSVFNYDLDQPFDFQSLEKGLVVRADEDLNNFDYDLVLPSAAVSSVNVKRLG